MNNIEENIIQYFENELTAAERKALEKKVLENDLFRIEFEQYKSMYSSLDSFPSNPTPAQLKNNFESFLAQEKSKHNTSNPKSNSSNGSRLIITIVGALLIATISFMFFNNRADNQAINQQMIAMNDNLKQLMQNESSSHRIKAVKLSAKLPESNQTAISLLLDALANDPSSNVRLSALEALEQHITNDKVRAAIYTSMAKENDQVVLITYINILSSSKEESAIDELTKITKDQSLDQFIKDEAHLGLFNLQEY